MALWPKSTVLFPCLSVRPVVEKHLSENGSDPPLWPGSLMVTSQLFVS